MSGNVNIDVNTSDGAGITWGIREKLIKDGVIEQGTNLSGSVWTEIMNAVVEENGKRKKGEKLYEGGSDLKGAWKDNFKVMRGKVLKLSNELWAKIVSIATGKTTETETTEIPVSSEPVTPTPQQEAPAVPMTPLEPAEIAQGVKDEIKEGFERMNSEMDSYFTEDGDTTPPQTPSNVPEAPAKKEEPQGVKVERQGTIPNGEESAKEEKMSVRERMQARRAERKEARDARRAERENKTGQNFSYEIPQDAESNNVEMTNVRAANFNLVQCKTHKANDGSITKYTTQIYYKDGTGNVMKDVALESLTNAKYDADKYEKTFVLDKEGNILSEIRSDGFYNDKGECITQEGKILYSEEFYTIVQIPKSEE